MSRNLDKLSRPDYLEMDESGSVSKMYCKECGAEIANKEYKVVGRRIEKGQVVEQVEGSLKRYRNYVELKMQMDNGSFHVTNMCSDSLKRALRDKELLQQLYEADIPYSMPWEEDKPRKVKRVVSVDKMQRGLK